MIPLPNILRYWEIENDWVNNFYWFDLPILLVEGKGMNTYKTEKARNKNGED